MKKIIIIAAIAATFVLAASAERVPSQGKVSFESTAMPELNCTVAMENVQSIYRLIPSNVTDICVKEYATIRKKGMVQNHFTHEGVDVKFLENGKTVTVVFSAYGCKVTVKNATAAELDKMFSGKTKTTCP